LGMDHRPVANSGHRSHPCNGGPRT